MVIAYCFTVIVWRVYVRDLVPVTSKDLRKDEETLMVPVYMVPFL